MGRFISADNIVPDPTNPQSLNRYSYVINSPLKYIDPTGHGYCDGSLNGNCNTPPSDPSTPSPPSPPPQPTIPSGSMVDFDGFNENVSYQKDLMNAIEAAAQSVGQALADVLNYKFGWSLTAEEAFLLVYGGTVTFQWMGVSADYGAEVQTSRLVYVYDTTDTVGKITNKEEWAIHELAHAFSKALRGVPTEDTRSFLKNTPGVGRDGAYRGDPNYYGFAGSLVGPWLWQHSTKNTPSEMFADMFVGWVKGKWAPIDAPDNSYLAGQAMSTYMDRNMSKWLNLAAYQ